MNKRKISSLHKRYSLLINELKEAIYLGSFYKWSHNKKQYLLARLIACIRKLQRLGVKTAVSATFLSSLLVSVPASAQFTPEAQCDPNPFEGIEIGYFPFNDPDIPDDIPDIPEIEDFYELLINHKITVVGDLNGDGLDDMVLISYKDDEVLRYFENTGSGLVELTGQDNPFNDVGLFEIEGLPWRPDIGDVDGDGDMDLLLFGKEDNGITELNYLENNNGSFEAATLEINGELGDGFGIFCDLDNDCDKDMIYFGKDNEQFNVSILENIDGDYELNEAMDAPFRMFESDFSDEMSELNIDLGSLFSDYTLGDFTSESTRGEMKPMLEEMLSKAQNLNELFDPMPPLSILSYPSCLDVNGDGDTDLLVLSLKDEECDFSFRYWEREGDGFTEQTGMDNPFDICLESDQNITDLSLFSLFGHDFGDIDGDGMLNLYFSFKDTDANTNELICLETEFDVEGPCGIRIPTLSQWGIYILGLLVIILGLVGIKSTNPLIRQSLED